MIETLIRNALLVDGTGSAPRIGALGIVGDRIAAIADRIDEPAGTTVDADGRVVSPGFIDLHNHLDLRVPGERASGMIRQGVTTLVTGNCGMSPFPDSRSVAGWPTLAGFTEAVDGALVSHVAPLIGHGSLRTKHLANPGAAASATELAMMVAAVNEAMEQGAFGMSTGLIYDPGRFSDTDELIALASGVAPFGGRYASHIRNEGDTLLDAVAEAIAIGRGASVPVHISHLKAKRRRNWGRIPAVLELVDAAVAAGQDVTFDVYPYTASNTTLWSFVPFGTRRDDVLAAGEASRDELRSGLEQLYPGSSLVGGPTTDLSDLILSDFGRPGAYSVFAGRGLDAAAAQAGRSQADLVVDLLLAAHDVEIIDNAMSEHDMLSAIGHPGAMVGSDALVARIDLPGHPHPRNFGTFPRFLRVATQLMPIEEAIRRCTAMPAQRMGLVGRGVLREGAVADLAMFDPADFTDPATFSNPWRYSTGLGLLLVSGQAVVVDDDETGATPGRVLRNTRG